MTDLPIDIHHVPSRLGTSARFTDGHLLIDTEPYDQTMHHDAVRASVVSFAVDAVAGMTVDRDPDAWCFTTHLSLHMRPMRGGERITAATTTLREGSRSSTSQVHLTTADGTVVGFGAVGFARVPRRPGDPPKPMIAPEEAPGLLRDLGTLSRPLREEAGIETLDAADGRLRMEPTPALQNPAGTLQGAMVALLVEAATEDLLEARFSTPVVVTDLEVHYLGRTGTAAVETRCRLVGDGPTAAVEVEIRDTATGAVTTLASAAASPLA